MLTIPFVGGHFQAIEPDPSFEESPILRYLLGWDYERNPDILPAPVPLPTPHVPLHNMPRDMSSLVMYNSSNVQHSGLSIIPGEERTQPGCTPTSLPLASAGRQGKRRIKTNIIALKLSVLS